MTNHCIHGDSPCKRSLSCFIRLQSLLALGPSPRSKLCLPILPSFPTLIHTVLHDTTLGTELQPIPILYLLPSQTNRLTSISSLKSPASLLSTLSPLRSCPRSLMRAAYLTLPSILRSSTTACGSSVLPVPFPCSTLWEVLLRYLLAEVSSIAVVDPPTRSTSGSGRNRQSQTAILFGTCLPPPELCLVSIRTWCLNERWQL